MPGAAAQLGAQLGQRAAALGEHVVLVDGLHVDLPRVDVGALRQVGVHLGEVAQHLTHGVLDEIAATSFTDPEATISVLKDYMQTGRFSRGPLEFSAQASIVLGGNIDTDLVRRTPVERYRHLFEVLPPELQDTAFLDRIHAFLPGWELPKIRPENYAQGYGFITDYLAEIFTRLRRRNYQTHVNAKVDFAGITGRNQDAIRKITAGLLKLIFPHRTDETLADEELEPCLSLAIECRERVLEQLAVMAPGEFAAGKLAVRTPVPPEL